MNSKPLISVIVPVYNVEKYLQRCLDSILRQTYTNLEIIVINNCSTDNSYAIAKSYAAKDKRIILIDSPEKGLSKARNKGISLAKGAYIGFIDSDDWISESYYEQLLSRLLETDADIAYASILYVEKKETYPLCQHKDGILTSFEEMINYQNNGSVWSKLFRRSLLIDEKNHIKTYFPIDLHWEDAEFLVKTLSVTKKMVLVPQATYFYRQHALSIMHNKCNEAKNRKDRLAIASNIYNYFKQSGKLKTEVINYILHVIFDKNLLSTDIEYRKNIEDCLSIRFTDSNEILSLKIALLGIPFLKINRKNNILKFHVWGIRIWKKFIDNNKDSFNIS